MPFLIETMSFIKKKTHEVFHRKNLSEYFPSFLATAGSILSKLLGQTTSCRNHAGQPPSECNVPGRALDVVLRPYVATEMLDSLAAIEDTLVNASRGSEAGLERKTRGRLGSNTNSTHPLIRSLGLEVVGSHVLDPGRF